jgi:hypothetical protein
MREDEPGVDSHIWQTRYSALGDELADDAATALPQLLDLVEEMLTAAGFDTTPGSVTGQPEVSAALARAREIVAAVDAGENVRADDAQQAAGELRELYYGLLDRPEAEAGPDLRRDEPPPW